MNTGNSADTQSSGTGLFPPGTPAETEVDLEQALVQFQDDLADFTSVNAFVVTSFAMMLAANEGQREEVIAGAGRCSEALISRSNELKDGLRRLRERYRFR